MSLIKKQPVNQFESLLNTELGEEYHETRDEYKAAKRQCKTVAEKKAVMSLYADALIDLAVECRLAGEMELNSELNQLIQSLNRRTYSGRRSW